MLNLFQHPISKVKDMLVGYASVRCRNKFSMTIDKSEIDNPKSELLQPFRYRLIHHILYPRPYVQAG
jgi:hypothetical protein